MTVPSGHDVLPVAGHGDGDGFPALRRWLVGNLGVDLAMLDPVAVEVRVDHEIVDTLEVHVRVRLHESFGSVHSPLACDFNEMNAVVVRHDSRCVSNVSLLCTHLGTPCR